MTKSKKTVFNISLALGLVSAILISMAPFADACNDMYENIVRIRVIANSNSETDQTVKLLVRDRLLESSKELFSPCKSEEEAVTVAENNLSLFKREADALLSEENFGYEAKAELRREFFPTREYDGFTLPAGEYDTLVVTLGDGGGENWWCVMFPQVCVGACSGRLTDTVAENSAEYAKNADKYILKFKVVEIFGRIRKKF